MGQRVLLVDAFATEPLTGEPFVISPDATLSETQLERVGSEFGAVGTISYRDETLHYTGSDLPVGAAVAGYVGLSEHGSVSEETLPFNAADFPGVEQLSMEDDGLVTVKLVTQQVDQPTLSESEVATALGISVDSLKDVGADLPLGRTAAHGGTLFVPVNFLEHLSRASPTPETLRELCDDIGVSRVMALSFDTLNPESAVHARIFRTDAVEGTNRSNREMERAADGIASGGCGAYLCSHTVFDGEYDQIQIESGHFIDRPSTLSTTLDTHPTVIGRGLTVLEGTAVIPEVEDDDIIEANGSSH